MKNIYKIKNPYKIINNPKIKIINYSNKELIGMIGELINKGKEYSIVKLNYTNIISNKKEKHLYYNLKIKNDCFKIIKD